jgi:hypothetical protein
MTIFVTKGDAPLSPAQLQKRSQKYIKRAWPDAAREQSIRTDDGLFTAFMLGFSEAHTVNTANNTFNWQLAEYGTAVARLAQYVLADGVPEYTVETPTGTYDDLGVEIMDVYTVAAVAPLDATVEVTTYDDEGVATTETVANPLIVADDAERTAAQAVIDVTPDDVKVFG